MQDEEIHELKMVALNLTESIVEAKTNASKNLLHELNKVSEKMEAISLILQTFASSGQFQASDDSDAVRNTVFHGFNTIIIKFLERIATKLEKPESAWSADKKTMATMAIFTGITTALNYLRGPIGRTGCYKKIAKKIGCPEEEKLAKKAALEALEAQVNVIQAAVNDRVKHEELDLLKGELDGEVETLTGRADAMATAERVTDLERHISELTTTLNILGGNFEEQAIRGSVEAKTLRDSIIALKRKYKEDYKNAPSRIGTLEANIQNTANDLDAHKAQFSHFM